MTLREKLQQMGVPVPDPLPDSVIDEETFPPVRSEADEEGLEYFKTLADIEDDYRDTMRRLEEEHYRDMLIGRERESDRFDRDYLDRLYQLRDFWDNSWKRMKKR